MADLLTVALDADATFTSCTDIIGAAGVHGLFTNARHFGQIIPSVGTGATVLFT
jgi:hypothetical protein